MIHAPLCETHGTGIFRPMKRKPPRPDPAGELAAVRQFRKALGRVIAEVRDGMGMTQEAFAAKLGLDQTTVAKAETGVHLWRMETWLRVGQTLKVPFYDLFKRALEKDTQLGSGVMSRRVEALDEQEIELVRVWRQLTPEGREILLGRARACLDLYHREDNVVPLVHEARGVKSRKSV